MVLTTFLAVVTAGVIGLAIKLLLPLTGSRDFFGEPRRISWSEYAVGMVLVTALVTPIVWHVGKSMSVAAILQNEESRNGAEQLANEKPERCYAGQAGQSYAAGMSNCKFAYASGSYTWEETYTESYPCSVSDGKGGTMMSTCTRTACCHSYTGTIYTPYATYEYTYSVTYQIGKQRFEKDYPGTYLAADPKPYSGEGIPSKYPRGAPADWLDAKRHIDEGDPRSVTGLFPYDNPVVAAKYERLDYLKADIDRYKKAGMLPDHTENILKDPVRNRNGRPVINKVMFAGVKPSNSDALQESLMRFNTALGSKLQGDLHVLVADANQISDKDRYAIIVRGYWLSPEYFQKRPLGKNGVILILGTRDGGKTIEWAKGSLAMPFGKNGIMLERFQTLLTGQPLDPDRIFGKPRTVLTHQGKDKYAKTDVTLSTPRGILEQIMFEEAPFDRPCMYCEDPEDKGKQGYAHLVKMIEPSGNAKTVMVLAVDGVSVLFWALVVFTSFLEIDRWRNRNNRRRNRFDDPPYRRSTYTRY